MDLPQMQQWSAEPALKESTLEKVTFFKRLVLSLLALIAVTFALMLWVLSYGDSYQEHAAAQGPSATWPDGSAKTARDWWSQPGGKPSQVAQPPAPAPQPQPQPNRG